MAQDVVGRGDMEEKLRQPVVGEVGLAAKLLFLRGAGTQYDVAGFSAVKLGRVQFIQKSQCIGQQRVKIGKSLLLAFVAGNFLTGQARRDSARKISGNRSEERRVGQEADTG